MILEQAAIIGGGVIGAGWAARLRHCGVTVQVHDPDPEAPRKFGEVHANAVRALTALMPDHDWSEADAQFASSIEEAVSNAQLVIESVPERLDVKRTVHSIIDDAASPDALVTSSTSGIRPSEIQRDMNHAERILVAHPFNPVYLLPLVELCGGQATSEETVEQAKSMFMGIGMHPLVVRQEIDGFIADRLMEALWREALWLIKDGVATTEEVDDAIRYGAGLRWALMGTFQTFWLAGGEGGMRAMLEMFGPCLKWPWSRLTDVPELTGEFADRIASQCDEQADGATPREMERLRDEGLVRILRQLEEMDWGAGKTVAAWRNAPLGSEISHEL